MINKILILFGFLSFINVVQSRVPEEEYRCAEDYGVKIYDTCYKWSECRYEEIEIIEATVRPKCPGFWPVPLCRGQIHCATEGRLGGIVEDKARVACKATGQNVCPNVKNCALDNKFMPILNVKVEPDIADELVDIVRDSKKSSAVR